MTEDDKEPQGLNILCIDGGGVRGLSSLLLLSDIMNRVGKEAGADAPAHPSDYFDIIAGSGTGGLSACMLGRLRMPLDQAIEAYVKLMEKVFSDKKIIGTSGYKGTTLREGLKSIVRDAIESEDEKIKQDQVGGDACKTMVFAMPKQHINSSTPVIFRSYDSATNSSPDCTIWEALYATMAHPDLFKSIEIDEHPIRHSFVGGDFGCSNPIIHVLTEVKRLYPNRHVSSILSIGTGHPIAIQIPGPSLTQRLLRTSTVTAAKKMAVDSEREAETMAARFQHAADLYYRFNVDQGLQDIDLDDWERLNEVMTHTRGYTRQVDTSRGMDQAAKAIQGRKAAISVAYIGGTIDSSATQQVSRVKRCPAPTSVFTGREDEILQIGNCIVGGTDERRVCVVHGLGGAGKTQLALKTIERHRDNWTHVLYIDASTKDAIEISLQGFAKAKSIGETPEDTLEWLGSLREPWLVVFDNADNPSLAIEEYFPNSSRGSILITTRLIDLGIHARGPNSICHVSGMRQQDALALLLKLAGKSDQELVESEVKAADALLEDLGHLALAIVHAGAYIGQRHLSISKYRELFLAQRRSILEQCAKQNAKVDKYEKSIYTTWKMCYDLLEENGNSRPLLWLLAFLHHNGITEDIFERAAIHMQNYEPTLPPTKLEADACDYVKRYLDRFLDSNKQWNTLPFLDALHELAACSLIEFDRANSTYSIHVLVQEWARTAIPLQLDFALECTTTLLSQSVDWDDTAESHSFRRKLGLHVDKALTAHGGKVGPNYAFSFSVVYGDNGRWDRAQGLDEYVKEARSQLLGAEHPATLLSMNNLVCSYEGQGRFDDAEALGVPVLDAYKRIFGEEHPITLASMANLARIYDRKGRWADSETLERQVLESRKRILGEEHRKTLGSIANLASILCNQGRWDEAEKLETQVLFVRERILGEEHPSTLLSMNNLAYTYSRQGRSRDAEVLQEKALAISRRTLGEEHPDTLLIMNNLECTRSEQGRRDDADLEPVKEQIMNVYKRTLGEEHPKTLTAMNNLAFSYQEKCRWGDALALRKQVLNVSKRVFGEEHPFTLNILINLASTYSQQGLLHDAEALEAQAVALCKRILGEKHPETLASMNNLASTYFKLGRWDDAAALQTQVLDVSQQAFGEEHPDTIRHMNNLAQTYSQQGRWKDSSVLQEQVLNIAKRTLGEEHPLTLTCMNNISHAYSAQERWDDARVLQEQVLKVRKRISGEESQDTLVIMCNLAATYLQQGRCEDAEGIQVQALNISKRIFGETNPVTLTCMNNLAETYSKRNRLEDAEALQVDVLNARKRTLGETHPDTLNSLNNLSCTYLSRGQWSEAETLMAQAVNAWDQIPGSEQYPDAVLAREGLKALRQYLASLGESVTATDAKEKLNE